ncbi:MAG: SRPBCC family protein [Campylobacterales bacterium]
MQINTEILIRATPERIWAILTDFARYGEWNPFIKQISGKAEAGAKLIVRIQPPGKGAMTFKPTVLEAAPGRKLEWLGHLWIPGLFDGRHSFTIEPAENGCHLIHSETFSGLLLPLVKNSLDATRAGFEAMNAALKARAEG